MKFFVVGASLREHDWWLRIRDRSQPSLVYINCSSRIQSDCINLASYKQPYISSPSLHYPSCSITDIYHEHIIWPEKSLEFLFTKFQHHYNLFISLLEEYSPSFVIVENGSYIFINALLKACRHSSVNVYVLESSDLPGFIFSYKNSKGPDLSEAVRNPSFALNKLPSRLTNVPLTHHKDKNVDSRSTANLFKLPLRLIQYFNRNFTYPYISTDGSLFTAISLTLTLPLKKLLIQLFHFKTFLSSVFRFSDNPAIVVPLHLEKDMHLSDRTSFYSQFQFCDFIAKRYPTHILLLKFHPHSVRLGLSLRHLFLLLFSRYNITMLSPADLNPFQHQVHSLGSKYSLESYHCGVKTYFYGSTFFTSVNSSFSKSSDPLFLYNDDSASLRNQVYFSLELYSNDISKACSQLTPILKIFSST